MLSFFLLSSLSITIPNEVIKNVAATYITNESISTLSEKEILVVFRTAAYNTFLVQPFTLSQTFFTAKSNFAVILEDGKPSLEFYRNSTKIASFTPIIDETTMLICLSTVLDTDPRIAETVDEVYGTFGQTTFTLIGSNANHDAMVQYAISVPQTKGVCSLCFATDEVLAEIGITDAKTIGVYHKVDNNIVTFNVDDEEDFNVALTPKFDYITFENMEKNTEKLTFFLMREEIDTNHSDFLFDMSEKFPQVSFAVLGPKEMSSINEYTHYYSPYGFNARMILINVSGGYFYNCDPYLGILKTQEHFDVELWEERATWFIESILKNEIPKTFKSEYVPRSSFPGITKVVGLTYEDYFKEKNSTDIVMYYVIDDLECRNLFDSFVEAGKIIYSEMNYTGCSLGFIDIKENMIEGGFPVTEKQVPVIGMFRAKDKKFVLMEGEITTENIGKFIKENGTNDFDYQQFNDIINGVEL